jgi:hypothetical protein
MIDVDRFETYISYLQLQFEEQTLDKISKIRVSPLSAIRNIKELNSNYVVDTNKRVHYVESGAGAIHHHEGMLAAAPPRFNTVNQLIQPKMPFTVDLGAIKQRTYGDFMPHDRGTSSVGVATPPPAVVANITRVYKNYKEPQNVVIPLQGQKRFGMRALFM